MDVSNDHLNEIRNFLIEKDKPLLDYVLEASIEEAEKLNTSVIRAYWHNIHLRQFLEMTYKDSNM